jgi:hypothetical protein
VKNNISVGPFFPKSRGTKIVLFECPPKGPETGDDELDLHDGCQTYGNLRLIRMVAMHWTEDRLRRTTKSAKIGMPFLHRSDEKRVGSHARPSAITSNGKKGSRTVSIWNTLHIQTEYWGYAGPSKSLERLPKDNEIALTLRQIAKKVRLWSRFQSRDYRTWCMGQHPSRGKRTAQEKKD